VLLQKQHQKLLQQQRLKVMLLPQKVENNQLLK
jgi:hypothetical protein